MVPRCVILGDSQTKYFHKYFEPSPHFKVSFDAVPGRRVQDVSLPTDLEDLTHLFFHLGTNNLAEEGPAITARRMERLLLEVQRRNPQCLLVVSSVLPRATSRFPGEHYDHSKHNHLPVAVMAEIKPIFKDLSNPELLRKCLHGSTQNPNESFNNVIWSRAPKNIFVMLSSLEIAVHAAVLAFNDGNIARCRVFNELGIEPGHFCVNSLKASDSARIAKSEKEALEVYYKVRAKRTRAVQKLEKKLLSRRSGPFKCFWSILILQ